jgi:hypothetical protein
MAEPDVIQLGDLAPNIAANVIAAGGNNSQTVVVPDNNISQQPAAQAPVAPIEAPASGTPPAAAAQQPAAFDETKWITDKFGDTFKSSDEIKTRLGEYEKTAKEIAELREQVKKAPVIADDAYVKGLNEARLKGISKDSYDLIQSIGDVKVLSNEDAVRKAMMIRDGLTETEAQKRMERKYKLGEKFNDMQDDEEVQDARLDLKVDAKADLAYLEKLSKEHQVPPQDAIAAKAQVEWSDTVATFADKNRSFKIPTTELGDLNYEVPAELAKEASDFVKDAMANGGFDKSADNLELMQTLYTSYIFGDAGKVAKVVELALTRLKDKIKLDTIAATSHPSALTQPVVTGGQSTNWEDAAIQAAAAKRGMAWVPGTN